MVPASVSILDVRLRGGGTMTIDGYHGSTLFATSSGGRMDLTNVASGATFLQPIYGRLSVADSSFDRLRVRAASAALVFDHDSARQIEATTINGTIVWDDGTFAGGLARFESTYGAIAVGVAGGAQVEARSGDGHVAWLWDKRTPLDARGDNEAGATVNGGGPLVSAVTAHGNVYLYDGSLTTRHFIPAEWRRISTLLGPLDASPAAAGMLTPSRREVRRAAALRRRWRERRRA
jgi:hypothetical protein